MSDSLFGHADICVVGIRGSGNGEEDGRGQGEYCSANSPMKLQLVQQLDLDSPSETPSSQEHKSLDLLIETIGRAQMR